MGRGLRAAHPELRGTGVALKLLDITEFYSPLGGGVRTYLAAKTRWLAQQDHIEHSIVVPGARDSKELLHGSAVYVVRGPAVPKNPGYHFLTGGSRLRQIIQEVRPDVIDVGSPFLAAWLPRRAARAIGASLVGFFHSDLKGYYIEHGLGGAPRALRRAAATALARYIRAAYRPCRLIVVPSRYAQSVLAWAGIHNTEVVPHGVDLAVFHPSKHDSAWRASVCGGAQVVALYAGRLSREKELDTVLEALPQLHAAVGLHVVFVGEGHLRGRIETYSNQNSNFATLLPFMDDRAALARAYASADLFLAPCPYETFGLAAIEAMASGTPVIGADAGGIGDLLDGASWGRAFRAGDVEDFTRAVSELLDAGTQRLGAEAREAAVSHYSWDRSFERLIGLYEGVDSRWSTDGRTDGQDGQDGRRMKADKGRIRGG